MNKKRWVFPVILACITLLCVTSATAYVLHTKEQYDGTCTKLVGVPGMLQNLYFVSSGSCQTKNDGVTCQNNNNCKVVTNPTTGATTAGRCTQVNSPQKACVCK